MQKLGIINLYEMSTSIENQAKEKNRLDNRVQTFDSLTNNERTPHYVYAAQLLDLEGKLQ